MLADAHVHLVGARPGIAPVDGGVGIELVVGTSPQDWTDVLAWAGKGQNQAEAKSARIPALGIHPWLLQGFCEEWMQELETRIRDSPQAQIGECGLDHVWRPRDGDTLQNCVADSSGSCWCKKCAQQVQRVVFLRQLALAAQYRRAISIHCVKAHGALQQALLARAQKGSGDPNDKLPRAINLHSWSGSVEITRQLINALGCVVYFGTSAHVNARNLFRYSLSHDSQDPQAWRPAVHGSLKTWVLPTTGETNTAPWRCNQRFWESFCERMACIPRGQLLLESDLCATEANRIAALELVATIAADALQCDVYALQVEAADNLKRFVDIVF